MAERAGIGGQLGIATEVTYGTYKAPETFLPLLSESLVLEKNQIKSSGIRAGRLVQSSLLAFPTTRTVSGGVNIELLTSGMGKILNLLHGETVTPTKVEEKSAWKQVHKIGLNSPYNKSLTVQVGRPDTGGTVRPFSYLGCKVMSAAISIEAQGEATLSLTLDGQDEKTSEALGTATYSTTAVPFQFQQFEVKVGGSKVANVRQVTFNVTLPQSTDRYHLGNSGIKDQPIVNGQVEVTADATLEFTGLTDHERFKNAENVKLQALGTGGVITESITNKANITATAARQVSSGPVVQGDDIITQDVSFECYDNGTETPLEVEYVSGDSAL